MKILFFDTETQSDFSQILDQMIEAALAEDNDLALELEAQLQLAGENMADQAQSLVIEHQKLAERERSLLDTAKKMTTYAKALKRTQGSIRHALKGAYQKGVTELPANRLSLRKSKYVSIQVSPENLPDPYQRKKIEADKTLLKKDLESGKQITGVSLEEREGIQIR